MSNPKSVFHHTEREFAHAINVNVRTVKRWVANGKIRSAKLSPRCRRLEEPEAFQAREAKEPVQ
jgi:predicted site-specific integrase-resolvase